MTAAAEQGYEPGWETYCAARDDYRTRHRHEPLETLARDAQRAGLAAVRSWWERHPGHDHEDHSELRHTSITAEKDRLKADGWTCLGYVTGYVLAPPGWERSTDRPTDPASPVDGAR